MVPGGSDAALALEELGDIRLGRVALAVICT